jgi:hypothetical protein
MGEYANENIVTLCVIRINDSRRERKLNHIT